jgi:hypothetical protein
VLGVKVLVTAGLWAGPALLLPREWFPTFGIPEPPEETVVFVRLLGAAYVALLVGYALAWQSPARHAAMIVVGAISNGLASMVILAAGVHGAFTTWGILGSVYIWGSALAAAAIAVSLMVTGQPLLRRIGERPRGTSAKVA